MHEPSEGPAPLFTNTPPYLPMEQNPSNTFGADLPEKSPLPELVPQESVVSEAFELLPDAVFVFNGRRELARANAASRQLHGEVASGTRCCEMFWYVEGAQGCVVDRAIDSCEKVEVEILSGTDSTQSIAIIVQPLSQGDVE